MIIISPITITDAMLTSASIAETDYAAWSAATAYTVGQRVIRTTTATHSIYERLIAGTTATAPESDTVNWVRVGPTNRWAAFDASAGTISSALASVSWTFSPGLVTSLALLEMNAATLSVVMRDGVGGTIVYSGTMTLAKSTSKSWSEYFFSDIVRRSSVVLDDLPPYSNGSITVTLTGSGTVSVGTVAVGKQYEVGATTYGASIGIVDYSVKSTDAFGVTTIAQRGYARKVTLPISVPTAGIDETARRLALVRATPCIYVGSPDYDSTIVYGLYRDWSIDMQYPNFSHCSITVEGLT